jgi:hypothetical protein
MPFIWPIPVSTSTTYWINGTTTESSVGCGDETPIGTVTSTTVEVVVVTATPEAECSTSSSSRADLWTTNSTESATSSVEPTPEQPTHEEPTTTDTEFRTTSAEEYATTEEPRETTSTDVDSTIFSSEESTTASVEEPESMIDVTSASEHLPASTTEPSATTTEVTSGASGLKQVWKHRYDFGIAVIGAIVVGMVQLA